MKKMIFGMVCLVFSNTSVLAENLVDVYTKAVENDTIYRERILNEKISYQDIRLKWAELLPTLNASLVPKIDRQTTSGSGLDGTGAPLQPVPETHRQYTLMLTATQTIFDVSKFFGVQQVNALSKKSRAELNAATQDLISRVSSAYFAILQAKDAVRFSEANQRSLEETLNQVKKEYEVGVKTITDVYVAEAGYSGAVAELVSAKNDLNTKKENLRMITQFYPQKLDDLGESFPMQSPAPAQIDAWVETALKQNWSIHAKRYAVDAAREVLRQQQAGHLPTLNATATVTKNQSRTFSENPVLSGSTRVVDRSLNLQLNMPLFAGGSTVAASNKADLQLSVAQTGLQQQMRSTVNETRTSYLGVISSMRTVEAGQREVKSSISSLSGMRESYNAGVATIVDVLTQQKLLFQAQKNLSANRYQYVNSLLALKKAAGTLSVDDLQMVNQWLIKKKTVSSGEYSLKKNSHHKKRVRLQHS